MIRANSAPTLKDCPFCGTRPAMCLKQNVWCNNDACAIVGCVFSGGVRHWNRRAITQTITKESA